jgi:hypothetical protein
VWNIFSATTEERQVLYLSLPGGGTAEAHGGCEGGSGGCGYEIGVCRGLCDSGRALKRGFVGKMKLQALLDRLARSHFKGCLELHFLDGTLKNIKVVSHLRAEDFECAGVIQSGADRCPSDDRNEIKGNERIRQRK